MGAHPAYVTGTVDQELLGRNEYLAAENCILKAQLKGRPDLSDAERGALGEIGHRLGRKVLADIATIARPDTILGWYRKLLAQIRDVQSAREQTVRLAEAKSPIAYGAVLASAIVLVGFAVMLWLVIREEVPANQRDMVTLLLGTLAGMASSVVAYWVGSSNGSMQKNAAIERAIVGK